MSENEFLAIIGLLIFGACLFLIGQASLWLINRSDLYSQDRYDKAFKQIIKRERQLDKQRARNERLKADGVQQHF